MTEPQTAIAFQVAYAKHTRWKNRVIAEGKAPVVRALASSRNATTTERRRHAEITRQVERTYAEARAKGVSTETLYWLTLTRVRVNNADPGRHDEGGDS